MKLSDFLCFHREHGIERALFHKLEHIHKSLAHQLHTIMATQAELVATLKGVLAEQQKSNAEIVFVQASVDTLTAKVAELQAIIEAGGGSTVVTQELIDAVEAVRLAAQAADDLIPDLIPPGPLAPVVSTALVASGVVGSPFNYAISASNSPTSFDAAPMPEGLAINTQTGVISGTPTTAGEYTIGLTASNASGVGAAALVLTVA